MRMTICLATLARKDLLEEGIATKYGALADAESGRTYKILRFDKHCKAEVFIGMHRSGERCLILHEAAPIKKAIDRERLCLRYDKEFPGLVLALSDSAYTDLFDELISSMYEVVKDVVSAQHAVENFRAHFIKWASFFDSQFSSKLSDDAVMGLVES